MLQTMDHTQQIKSKLHTQTSLVMDTPGFKQEKLHVPTANDGKDELECKIAG